MALLQHYLPNLRRALSTPLWNRYLFELHRPNHVVWAVVLVFGILICGLPLTFLVARRLAIHDLTWLRVIWTGGFTTVLFIVALPIRRALSLGIALFAGQCAHEWFRRAMSDDWRALAIYVLATMLMSMLMTAMYVWHDARADHP